MFGSQDKAQTVKNGRDWDGHLSCTPVPYLAYKCLAGNWNMQGSTWSGWHRRIYSGMCIRCPGETHQVGEVLTYHADPFLVENWRGVLTLFFWFIWGRKNPIKKGRKNKNKPKGFLQRVWAWPGHTFSISGNCVIRDHCSWHFKCPPRNHQRKWQA